MSSTEKIEKIGTLTGIGKLIAVMITENIPFPVSIYKWGSNGLGITIQKAIFKTRIIFNGETLMILEIGDELNGTSIKFSIHDIADPTFDAEAIAKRYQNSCFI